VVLLCLIENFIVVSEQLSISTEGTSLLAVLRSELYFFQLIVQQQVLVCQIIDLFFKFPLSQTIIFLLLIDSQLILLDQRLNPHVILFLS